MKGFFSKIGAWFKNHMPTRRRIIQIYTALLYNANIKGFVSGLLYTTNSPGSTASTKKVCVPGMNCYSCPGAIGACPLGSLQNALEASDTRTPYYVIGILVLFGVLLGRTICGFLCPVGLFQELLYKIKTPKLKKNSYTRVFSYTKYIILVALVIVIPIFLGSPTFCKYICPAGTFEGGIGLLSNPNNANYLPQLADIFTWKFAVLVSIIVLCIFIFRFFCRFICPLGAIYGFFNKFALLGVKLEKDKCTECGLCIAHCKMDIRHVGDHECINCGECIPVCPTKAISWKGSKIFLSENQMDVPEEAPALATVLNSGTTANAEEQIKPLEAVAVNAESVTTIFDPDLTHYLPESEEIVESDKNKAESPKKAVKKEKALKKAEKQHKPKNLARRNKILEAVAWSLAGILLAFALIFYNFIVPEEKVSGVRLHTNAPNFTLSIYDGDGLNEEKSYSLEDSKGKVVVLNFWTTTCDPCIKEMPNFNKLKQTYGDEVEVVAIHGITPVKADVQDFINNSDKRTADWKKYTGIIFAQDASVVEYNDQILSVYKAFGGKNAYPVTAILDANGVFKFSWTGSIQTYKQLEEAYLKVRNH